MNDPPVTLGLEANQNRRATTAEAADFQPGTDTRSRRSQSSSRPQRGLNLMPRYKTPPAPEEERPGSRCQPAGTGGRARDADHRNFAGDGQPERSQGERKWRFG